MGYRYKTEPFKHQREIFEDTWDREILAAYLEMGLGKSKIMIDTAARLRQRGKIDAMLVIAPNGVHTNWLTDEIPAHMPDKILSSAVIHCHTTSGAKSQRAKRHATELLKADGMAILLISYSSIMTKNGDALVKAFLRRRKAIVVLDEAHYIKTPGAKRTKRVLSYSNLCKYRRLATGTPVANSPFDVYTQLKFLDPMFWKEKGFSTFHEFKSFFGIFKPAPFAPQGHLVGYKNLDYLKNYVDEVGIRMTKDSAGLELPERLFSKRYFNMTPVQRRMYNEVKVELESTTDCGQLIEVDNPLVKALRLQQITCNYLPSGDTDNLIEISDTNPRLEALKEICQDLEHPCIIWARFKEDIDQIMDLLGPRAVRYDGSVDTHGRQMARDRFKNGTAQFMVINQAAGSTGLTLNSARTMIYYSNSYNYVHRIQSQDRNYRIGQDYPVFVIDLVCKDTMDEEIIDAFKKKQMLSNQITGDVEKPWL